MNPIRVAAKPQSNPFATRFVRPGAIDYIFPAGVNVAQLLEQFTASDYLGQIVGGHGTGKSTLLATLTRELEERAHAIVQANASPLQCGQLMRQLWQAGRRHGMPLREIVIVDGFERLTWWQRAMVVWWAKRLRSGLLVTCHQPCRLPLIWTTVVTQPIASEVIRQLTTASPGARRLAFAHFDGALRRHQGNLREALFDLYDTVAKQAPISSDCSSRSG